MSKLETAFSKAMREQSPRPAPNSTSSGAEIENKYSALRTGGGKEAAISAKNQISNMAANKALSDEELAHKRLIHPRMKDKKLLNIYRNLRTKLLSTSPSSNFITLVTSIKPSLDSSLISANIAATFAFDEGKTALLIEGNVHSPILSKTFGVEKDGKGLMECLESETLSVSEILYETGIPRLRFIPAGRSMENSAEFYNSSRMRRLINEVCERYPERYPIIDAPSIEESADTRILLGLCDHVILVLPYGECTEEEIKTAARTIGTEKLLGVVLNQF